MKALCPLAAFSVALILASCSSTQTAEGGAAGRSRAAALVERPGNIFNTRGKRPAKPVADTAPAVEKAQTEAEADKPVAEAPLAAPVPTEAQQKAAEALLASPQADAPAPAATPAPAPEPAAPTEEPTATPSLTPLNQSLRMGSIVPAEEAASATDAPAPAANSVEMRGLRSPKLPTSLPMGIDGKLQGGN